MGNLPLAMPVPRLREVQVHHPPPSPDLWPQGFPGRLPRAGKGLFLSCFQGLVAAESISSP